MTLPFAFLLHIANILDSTLRQLIPHFVDWCNTKRRPCITSGSLCCLLKCCLTVTINTLQSEWWCMLAGHLISCCSTIPFSPCNSRQILTTFYFTFLTSGPFIRIYPAERMWLSVTVSHFRNGNLTAWQPAFNYFTIVLNCFHSGQSQRALPTDTDGLVKKSWSADMATCRLWLTLGDYPL